MLAVAPTPSFLPELFSIECWGGATFDVALRFFEGRPWGAPDPAARGSAQRSLPDALLRLQCRGATPLPDNVVRYFTPGGGLWKRRHGRLSRLRFPSTGWTTCASPRRRNRNQVAKPPSATAATHSTWRARNTTCATTVDMAKQLEKAGAHIIATSGHGWRLPPLMAARALVKALREEVILPITSIPTTLVAAAPLFSPPPRPGWMPPTPPWTP